MDINQSTIIDDKSWKRGFLTIVSGQTLSLIGSAAVQFSLIWWLASETASPLMMSIAGLFAFLPQLLLGPFVGVWIDRIKRKTVIICADLFQGLIALAFALFFLTGNPPHWSACVVLGVRSLGSVFHTPAISAAVPMLVPEKELVRANGWSRFMQSGAFMLGPVIGAAMYASLPLWIILLSDLLGAAAASITVAAVKIPDPEQTNEQKPHFFREMREGATVFLNDRKLLTITLCAALSMVFYMPLSSYYPLMSSDHFAATAWHGGLVECLYAGGMMLSALLIGKMRNIKNRFWMMHMGLLGLGLSSLFCGVLPSDIAYFWIFAIMCFVMGASGTVYEVPYTAYMQSTIAPEMLGRAFSLMGTLKSAAMPIGLFIAGPIAERYGVSMWFLLSGVAITIVTFISAALVLPRKKG